MHHLCFDIHHLVLTTAKCHLIVPWPWKHKARNIFRSQSFKTIADSVLVYVCVCVWGVCSFLVKNLNMLLTLQKRAFRPLK